MKITTRTIKELNDKIEEVRIRVANGELQEGDFGIRACKDSILWEERVMNKSLFEQYWDMIRRASYDYFFNFNMIVACEELMKGRE